MIKDKIGVIIPAYNEEDAIAKVIQEIPAEWVNEITVVDNNSKDNTARIAEKAGATVFREPRQG